MYYQVSIGSIAYPRGELVRFSLNNQAERPRASGKKVLPVVLRPVPVSIYCPLPVKASAINIQVELNVMSQSLESNKNNNNLYLVEQDIVVQKSFKWNLRKIFFVFFYYWNNITNFPQNISMIDLAEEAQAGRGVPDSQWARFAFFGSRHS